MKEIRISRTLGAGDVQLFVCSMRCGIWMNPTELTKYQLTPVDVINAIKAQNARVAAGHSVVRRLKASSLTHRLAAPNAYPDLNG